jgi:NADH:ubiquinone oxidoreductase subunit 6 (subunit J)
MITIIALSALVTVSALVAALSKDTRHVVLGLWVCGMSMGGIFLSFGAEVLAMAQWIVATLGGVSLLMASSMCGELGKKVASRRATFDLLQAIIVGVGMTAVFGVALFRFQPEMNTLPQSGQDLQALGQLLTEKHSISLNLLAVTLLLVLVGGGVLSRAEEST